MTIAKATAMILCLLAGPGAMARAATVSVDCPGTEQRDDREFRLTTDPGAQCVAWGVGNLGGMAGVADPLFALLDPAYRLIDRSDRADTAMDFSDGGGMRSGLWSFLLPATPTGYRWADLVLAMVSVVGQFDVTWSAYALPPGVTDGRWSVANGHQSLANANLYGQLVPSAVPLPAAGLLMVGALGAVGALRRRQRG